MGRPAGKKQPPKVSHVGEDVYPGFEWEVRPKGKVVIIKTPKKVYVRKKKEGRSKQIRISPQMFTRMCKMLLQTNFPIKQIASEVGTNSNSACRYFLKKTGLTMREWKKRMGGRE